MLNLKITKPGDVPCGPCQACCHSDVALLEDEGDIVESYEHELVFMPGLGEWPFLKHKKNGECVYLGRNGCTIRERRPHMCRIFDCRVFYFTRTREERWELAKGNPRTRVIFNAGKQRLNTLDLTQPLPRMK